MFNRSQFYKQVLRGILLSCFMISLFACKDSENKAIQHQSLHETLLLAGKTFTIDPGKQRKLADDYLHKYFSPWNRQQLLFKSEAVKKMMVEVSAKFALKPGFGANANPHGQGWIDAIVKNANLPQFPNLNMRGIIVNDTEARMLPSVEPSFTNLTEVGQGYPFDNLQQSFVWAGTPVFVFHVSHDGAWYLVITSNYIAWVQKKDLAFVDQHFVDQWQRKTYVVPTHDHISLFDGNYRFIEKTGIGAVYPLHKITAHYYQVLDVGVDQDQRAIVKVAYLPKAKAAIFPMRLTSENVATLALEMLGSPYGWGGMYGYRDCSCTMMDLFATFGVWLARNSGDQIDTPDFISFKDLNSSAKEQVIINQGVPLLTLIHKPGHIMLYAGQKNGEVYIFHDTWGEIPAGKLFFWQKRQVVGSTVITPLRFKLRDGKTLLDTADGMRILVPISAVSDTKALKFPK